MSRSYSYDSKMLLADGAAATTADGIGQVASANKIIDLGGTGDVRTDLSITGTTVSRLDAACIINISAITTATDGVYGLYIMGSNNSDGSKPCILGAQRVGLGASLPNGTSGSELTGAGNTTVAGRREIFFSTQQNSIFYRYIYLYIDCEGSTSHSITLTAYVAKLPIE